MELIFLLLIIVMLVMGGRILAKLRGLGRWNRTYRKLSLRFAGKKSSAGVMYGYLLSNPSLEFDYGRTRCVLRNRRAMQFSGQRQTELVMRWPDRRLRLEIQTTSGQSDSSSKNKRHDFYSKFEVNCNQPVMAQHLVSGPVQWQLEKLGRIVSSNCGNQSSLSVTIDRGAMLIAAEGYMKHEQPLDDFVRSGLDLFDQMMLATVEGIQFLHADQATILTEVECPICSEMILDEMVVCERCKTPHCLDCWQYNGQCATYACRETRFVPIDCSKQIH